MSSGADSVLTDMYPKWIYGPPADEGVKCLLLTRGGIAIIGNWRGTHGIIAHCALPKRDKDLEKKLGIISYESKLTDIKIDATEEGLQPEND
jgi:hypothetical protein